MYRPGSGINSGHLGRLPPATAPRLPAGTGTTLATPDLPATWNRWPSGVRLRRHRSSVQPRTASGWVGPDSAVRTQFRHQWRLRWGHERRTCCRGADPVLRAARAAGDRGHRPGQPARAVPRHRRAAAAAVVERPQPRVRPGRPGPGALAAPDRAARRRTERGWPGAGQSCRARRCARLRGRAGPARAGRRWSCCRLAREVPR